MPDLRRKGFTLVEMLVVLTMVSLISALLFQGYGYLLGSYQRLKSRQQEGFQQSLADGWWRSSLEALVPYYDNPLRFSGDPSSLRGASYSPVASPAGVAHEIAWRLEPVDDELRLLYQEPPGEPVVVHRWERSANAAFEYLTEQGQWRQDWLSDDLRQLPEAVRLVVSRRGTVDTEILTAVVLTRKSQFIPATDVLYGRE